jgi:hypothetical protein
MCTCEERLYRGFYAAATSCDKCGQPRYHEDTQTFKKHGRATTKRTPRKVYRYFPIALRLKQLLAHPIYSRLFRHGENMRAQNRHRTRMPDIYCSQRWNEFANDLPLFSEDAEKGVCDLRVGFVMSADSASMSKFSSAEFSLTPFILSLLNWPVKVRTKVQHLFFTGISPMNNKATAIYLGTHTHTHTHTHTYIHTLTQCIHVCMCLCA